MSTDNLDLINVLQVESINLATQQKELEEQSRSIQQEIERIRMRQDLISALLDASGQPRSAAGNTGDETSPSAQATGQNGGTQRDIGSIAYEILRSRGKKPMYYEDLAAEVVKAGGHLGGQTPAQSLVARICRDPRFVRPEKRGWYAAVDFYPKAKSVGARKPVSRIKRGQSTVK